MSNFMTIFHPRSDQNPGTKNSALAAWKKSSRSILTTSWWVWIWILLRNPCDLCFSKSRVNSVYLWVRFLVRACLAVFANCGRPHSVSWSRPERQHPWERRDTVRQILCHLTPKHWSMQSFHMRSVIFLSLLTGFPQRIQCNYLSVNFWKGAKKKNKKEWQ